MSESIKIPRSRTYAEKGKACESSINHSSSNSSSAASSVCSSSPRTPHQSSMSSSVSSPSVNSMHYRRPSLLGSSFTKSEHTVINIGDPDGVPRLITCVKSSQGFDWNPEIFLPSYVESDFESLERKREPVIDIFLTDEEAAAMLPK